MTSPGAPVVTRPPASSTIATSTPGMARPEVVATVSASSSARHSVTVPVVSVSP